MDPSLAKQATPRSYVQYLEARVRQLEGQKDTEWSPQASSSRHSPYGEQHAAGSTSSNAEDDKPKRKGLPDWTVLRELGTHVVDEDGFTRYMGPSSGVSLAARCLQTILDDDEQPQDPEFYCLFSLEDFARNRALAAADVELFTLQPTNLPDKQLADTVCANFFLYTERVFPVLHRPTFLRAVDELYSLDFIGHDRYEFLAQFYFVLSIGHWFDSDETFEARTDGHIRAIQCGARTLFTTFHTRRDGLERLQTLTLHGYALTLLRQRSEALRWTAAASIKTLEVGLHHDGRQFTGNPLETEMRRRIFWCVFMLHLFNCSLEGLPRSLHEADITIVEPNDIDDDQLTTTEVTSAFPGRTKIHRFVSVCRLTRILSRTLDVLYTHNKRRQASTRIEQMNRLCCEHLLDQLNFSSEETPDDIPDPSTEDPAELAVLAGYANEQLLFHYIRWQIHRPGLTLPKSDAQYAACLQIATEAAIQIAQTADKYQRALRYIKANPAAHPCTIFIVGLTPLYRTARLRSASLTIPMLGYTPEADYQACQHTLSALASTSHDHSDVVRRRVYQKLMVKVFGAEHEELSRLEAIPSHQNLEDRGARAPGDAAEQHPQQLQHPTPGLDDLTMDFYHENLEMMNVHEDMTNFVQEAFDPSGGMGLFGYDDEVPGQRPF